MNNMNMNMNDNVTISKATEKDIKSIVSIWEEMMKFHYDRDKYFELSDNAKDNFEKYIQYNLPLPHYYIIVAKCGNEAVGFCQAGKVCYPPVYRIREYCEVFELAITEKYRRKGIGEKLLQDVFTWAKKEKLSRTECKVAISNEISTQFWRKMKFRPYLESMYLEL